MPRSSPRWLRERVSISPALRLSGVHSCRFQHHHLLVHFLLCPALALGGIAKSHQLEVQGKLPVWGPGAQSCLHPWGQGTFPAHVSAWEWEQPRTLAMWCWVAVSCTQACSRLCEQAKAGAESGAWSLTGSCKHSAPPRLGQGVRKRESTSVHILF